MGQAQATETCAGSFYDLVAKDADGKDFPFSDLKGKVVLIVNVASKCGFTGQYKGLEELHQKYKDKGLVILGFPCNQFGGQEPGSAKEVVEFCSATFRATFPIMDKVEVNGDNTCSVYRYLKEAKPQFFMKRVKWNFEKFLVRRDGIVENRYSSASTPSYLDPIVAKLLETETKA